MRRLLNRPQQKIRVQRHLIALLAWIAFVPVVQAANVEVRARLSDPEATVGMPVRMEIIVQGARSAEVPRNVAVDGLEVRYVGESVQIQMINFQVSSNVSYTYMLTPRRGGNFTIPTLDVNVNDRVYRTEPLRLTVYDPKNNWDDSSAGAQSTPTPAAPIPAPTPSQAGDHSLARQEGKLAFGILVVPKKQIYVGEVLPVEICYYFHPNLPVQSVNSMPSLIGDNFVVTGSPGEGSRGDTSVCKENLPMAPWKESGLFTSGNGSTWIETGSEDTSIFCGRVIPGMESKNLWKKASPIPAGISGRTCVNT